MGSTYRRASTLLIVPLLLAALVGVGPADAAVVGDLWGGADADLLEVSAVSLPPGCGDESGTPIVGEAVACEFELAQLIVGDTEAGADSDAALTYDGETGVSAFGHASNLDPDALTVGGTEGTLSAELLVESNAIQPGGETTDSDQLLSFPDNPVLGLDVATTEATAFDVSDGNTSCPSVDDGRAVIASGRNELLGLVVGPGAVDGGDFLATQDPEQVSYAESRIELVDDLVGGADDGVYGMETTATVQLAPIVLFGGELVVEIGTPVLTVAHDGQDATVTYETPLVTINGEAVVDGETIEFLDALDLPGNPLLNVTVGIADAEDVTIDGETATVSDVVTLDIVLGDPGTDMALGVASLSVGDLNAAAFVGPDGVTIDGCGTSDDPLAEVAKDVTATVVAPGETFDYVITVPNRGTCTLTDVVVTDTVTGPDGFEIVATESEATSIDGGTLTWEVGELAPNETASFTITVRAPEDASAGDMFRDVVDVTGTCDGEAVDGGDELDLPGIFVPSNAGCDVSDSNKAATHVEVTPGQTFSYLVHAFNSGDADCGLTTVTDELQEGVDFVSCNADCTATGSTVTWELEELAAGASRTLVVTVAVNDDAVVGERLPNSAVIDPANGSPATVATEGPLLGDESILAEPDPASPSASTPAGDPDQGSAPPPAPAPVPDLPATGGGAVLGGLASIALAGALRRGMR